MEFVEGGNNRQTAYELGDKPKLDEIFGLDLTKEFTHIAIAWRADLGPETN